MQLSLTICLWVACLAPATILAQVKSRGKCPKVTELRQFDLCKFKGIWYQYSSYEDVREIGTKCNTVQYDEEDKQTVSAKYSYLDIDTGAIMTRTDMAKIIPPAQLQVGYSENDRPYKLNNFIVIGTDYKSYAVIYSCIDKLSGSHLKHVWIFTRSRNPSQRVIDATEKVLKDNKISTVPLIKSNQQTCPKINLD